MKSCFLATNIRIMKFEILLDTHIIGSASWPKIKNFQYHLSVIVVYPLGIHFLPIDK